MTPRHGLSARMHRLVYLYATGYPSYPRTIDAGKPYFYGRDPRLTFSPYTP